VIGAGQAGLSTAYYLARAGLTPGQSLVTLDRGPQTGGAWQHRWDELKVGDTHRIYDLPGMRETGLSFSSAPRDEPAREVVARYYDIFERHYGLKVRRPTTVLAVTGSAPDFTVIADTPRGQEVITAKVIVNASGTWRRPRVPRVAGKDDFRGMQVTTPEYTSAAAFIGRRVAVVGAGTSAIGFLDELTRIGVSTTWFTRRPPEFVELGSELSREAGAAAVAQQDASARAGERLPSIASATGLPLTPRIRRLERLGTLRRQPMFARIVTDGVVTTAGTHTPFDAIIWATGFDAELDHLELLSLASSQGGIAVSDGESTRVPGVFLAGYGPQASTIGANWAGRTMARAIMQRLT